MSFILSTRNGLECFCRSSLCSIRDCDLHKTCCQFATWNVGACHCNQFVWHFPIYYYLQAFGRNCFAISTAHFYVDVTSKVYPRRTYNANECHGKGYGKGNRFAIIRYTIVERRLNVISCVLVSRLLHTTSSNRIDIVRADRTPTESLLCVNRPAEDTYRKKRNARMFTLASKHKAAGKLYEWNVFTRGEINEAAGNGNYFW